MHERAGSSVPASAVRSMFDHIAPVYDAMNTAMSLGLDARWPRSARVVALRSGMRA